MSEILVSVIVTVHNSQEYIEKCLLSVINQTINDIEIICIDGGSNDSTPQILKKMESYDRRIRVINDPNTSYGHKVNVGIRLARGKYISVLESDDAYYEYSIEKLYDLAESIQADYVDGEYFFFFNNRGKELGYRSWNVARFPFAGGITSSMYRKEFLIKNRIFLNETKGAAYQDVSFGFLTRAIGKKHKHIEVPVYKYRIDNESSSVYDSNKVFEILDEFAFLSEKIKLHGINSQRIWRNYYLEKYSHIRSRYEYISLNNRRAYLSRAFADLERDVKYGCIKVEDIIDGEENNIYHYYPDITETIMRVPYDMKKTFPERMSEIIEYTYGKKIVLCCYGNFGKRMYAILVQNDECVIDAICDAKQGDINCPYSILSYKEAVTRFSEDLFIISSRKNRNEVRDMLLELGINKTQIISY